MQDWTPGQIVALGQAVEQEMQLGHYQQGCVVLNLGQCKCIPFIFMDHEMIGPIDTTSSLNLLKVKVPCMQNAELQCLLWLARDGV